MTGRLPAAKSSSTRRPTARARVDVRLERETVWLRQEQMSQLFERERSVITKHIRNVFAEGELDEKSNVQNLHIAGSDKPVRFYNLEVIISVGYRVKSVAGTRFRQWATRTLREHLVRGYTINRQRFEHNARVGAEKRLALVAKDIVEHFEQRLEAMDGKAMIVCMSRRICVELHREIVKLRPDWDGADDERGALKVVMTGSASDPARLAAAHPQQAAARGAGQSLPRPEGPFKLVLVRDMWLTGFDAPSLHTMYIDKPMRGHGLMQAIARVNRVFKDKPGGLVVDYLGLAQELKQALATYTESGGTGRTALDQDEAVAVMLEKYEVCAGLFHGFDWGKWTTGTPPERLGLLPAAQEHILAQEGGKDRCGGVPGRGARDAPAQPRGGVAAEAAQGRTGHPPAQERRAGAVLCRDAGADDPTLPEPRH